MRFIRIFALAGCLVPAAVPAADTPVEESRMLVREFAETLKGHLQGAMKAGGPVNAIRVCNLEAPEIARRMSLREGWTVARTSLKVRNPDNAPDAWERAVLEQFEARRVTGEAPASLEHFETVVQEGETVFRYMKAIPTAPLCLACHGKQIDPQVKAELARRYPDDQATGFEVGDIRGAFTITKGP